MTHEGKIVLVTGGAHGIGRACVERFVADGAQVVIADVDLDEAKALERACDDRAWSVAVDVTSEASVEDLVAQTVSRFGRLDVAVNNAGILFTSELAETAFADWKRLFDVNVHGVFLCAKAAAKQMTTQQSGVIINAASAGGRTGHRFLSHYCSSKAAVIMLSQSLALELAPSKVRVNCYAPGFVETPMLERFAAELAGKTGSDPKATLAAMLNDEPLGRFARPEDVANAVSWLASDEAAHVTGECLTINGGASMW